MRRERSAPDVPRLFRVKRVSSGCGAEYKHRIRKMGPPEVRVNGDDPSLWEWDGPDEKLKPGDRCPLCWALVGGLQSGRAWLAPVLCAVRPQWREPEAAQSP